MRHAIDARDTSDETRDALAPVPVSLPFAARAWRRGRFAPVILALALFAVGVVGVSTQQPSAAAPGLADLFEAGRVFQDRNGDGVVDFVEARMVLGDDAGPAEVSAAADVAARLGFETSAMDVPLRSDGQAAAIVIGAGGVARAGLAAADYGIAALEPGEGLVAAAEIGGKPGAVIAGGDEAGTLAAAMLFAGRLPHLWDPNGVTVKEVSDQVRAFLAERGVAVTAASPTAAHVVSGANEVERLVVHVQAATPADVAKAQAALKALSPAPRPARAGASAPPPPSSGPAPLSFAGARAIRVRLAAPGAAPVDIDVPRTGAVKPGPLGRRPGSAAKENLDLSTLYGIEGFLGDSDDNLIPDRVDVLLSPGGDGIQGSVDLAARLGLESAGVSLPIARPAGALEEPEEEPTLVLIGTAHPLIDRLAEDKQLDRSALQVGEGLIQVVPKAFGDKSAVVITGGDGRGVARAVRQVAERFPHVWARGKDRTTIDDIEDDVRRFLGGRSPAGQAATALYKLDRLTQALAGQDLESAQVIVSLEKPAEGLADVVRKEAGQKLKVVTLDVTVDDRDVQKAKTIFEDEFEVASEVDEFWQVLRTKVVPALKKRQPVVVEARLSEPPEIRAALEKEARTELVRAGALESGSSVTVLSAYKQGYSWLYDVVRPALAGKPVDQITIRFAEIGAPPEWKQQAMYAPTRWLLEAFPIDEILARELKLDLSRIRFEKRPIGSSTYEVVATAPGGAEVLRQTFEPKFVLRSFFDRFADYEKVRVTTGWIVASVAGRPIVDQRIVTDVERFWDHYQAKTLPAIYDYVMANARGKPRREDAPHFGELVVDLTLSEPDYSLNLDKEQISSLEAMHEEIYFHTLHFFDVLGRHGRGEGLDYPGRVIPVMRPKKDGKPGHAKIRFSGFATNRPAVLIRYRERGGQEGEVRLDIPKVALSRPTALAAWVRDGRDGLERLALRVKVDSPNDERDALVRRARAEQVETQMISAEQVAALVANLSRLRAAGLYREALAYHDLRGLEVAAAWEHDLNPATQVIARLDPNGVPAPFPDITKQLKQSYRYAGGPIVQWDTPIPPPEAAELLAKMSTFKEATVYKAGHSYLGQDIWAMDLMPLIEASHWSHAKATTMKPTIVYSGRQDANEVSSTSHILKLAELLLTDAEFKKKLQKVNVVVHPITNPDGAQLAYDLYTITPDYMLHAGYLGPLGVSLVSRWDSDPTYPESRIRPTLWRTWLPDIFLNPHGYPSHEWVQLFSEYAAWVRNRATESRDWQQMRGWFIPGFNYLDDPKYPRHKTAAFKIRELITKNINTVEEIRALNRRAYDRYRRYGFAHDNENFKLDFTNDVLIYTAIKGATADPGTRATTGDDYMVRRPNVTIWFGGTEAPDETAYGDWMKLTATMGLQWDTAILEYLVQGNHVVERKGTPFFGGVNLALSRPRPPKSETGPSAASEVGVGARN